MKQCQLQIALANKTAQFIALQEIAFYQRGKRRLIAQGSVVEPFIGQNHAYVRWWGPQGGAHLGIVD